MVGHTSKALDMPQRQAVVATLIYACFLFFFGPFFLYIFRLGFLDDFVAVSWLEIVFHIINLLFILSLVREHLEFSWWTVGTCKGKVALTVLISVLIMLGVAWDLPYLLPAEFAEMAAQVSMPIVEASLFMTPVFVATSNPIFGTLAMVLIAPVVTCNIFYSTVFTAGYNKKPWLGYVYVALLAAVLQFLNGVIWRELDLQLILYVAQLPIHMICCWAYQNTDTVWTPMIAQAAGNLIVCLYSIFYLQ